MVERNPAGEVTRVLVLGASGMLGHTVLRCLHASPGLSVTGSMRFGVALRHFPAALAERVILGVDVENADSLTRLFSVARPDVVVNCVGLVKQLASASDPLAAVPINTLLPHRLARLCGITGARLIHISTDCVFSGSKGCYVEGDPPDATDLYGLSKYLGEVDYPHAVTLRTSLIGHELGSAHGLVEWFLAQSGEVRGFTHAIFSGLPTDELARVIRDHVIPRAELTGVYHVSSGPVSKYDLLGLIADAYGHQVRIVADDSVVVDRSLDSSRFRRATGYTPGSWPALVDGMRQSRPTINCL